MSNQERARFPAYDDVGSTIAKMNLSTTATVAFATYAKAVSIGHNAHTRQTLLLLTAFDHTNGERLTVERITEKRDWTTVVMEGIVRKWPDSMLGCIRYMPREKYPMNALALGDPSRPRNDSVLFYRDEQEYSTNRPPGFFEELTRRLADEAYVAENSDELLIQRGFYPPYKT